MHHCIPRTEHDGRLGIAVMVGMRSAPATPPIPLAAALPVPPLGLPAGSVLAPGSPQLQSSARRVSRLGAGREPLDPEQRP